MAVIQAYLFPAMWFSYLGYWWVMSRNVSATEHRESAASRLIRLVSIVAAVALLWLPSVPIPLLRGRFLPLGAYCFWSGAGLTAAGLLFGVWARHHLGSNWSQAVTIKDGHELITSGPYALVRHPIYAGLVTAFVGCAVARGEWRGLVAVGLVLAVLWRKVVLEERWMAAHFGASHEAYARRVAAFLPFLI